MRREEQEILRVYANRDKDLSHGHRNMLSVLNSCYREILLYTLLSRWGLIPLRGKLIVDFGCGTGARLREFMRFGAVPEQLFGMDLSMERLEISTQLNPRLRVQRASCARAPYREQVFDIVINSTMMSSILDDRLATDIASEMRRVLKPNGVILWYDMRVNNPRNPSVRGYSLRRIRQLFPGWVIDAVPVALPTLLASVIEIMPWLYAPLNVVRVARTHYLALIRNTMP